MAAMRARESQRFTDERFLSSDPRITLRAGDSLVLRVGALDRQSGVAEIVARCRSRENHDLTSFGRWNAVGSHPAPSDHYYPVVVAIPAHSPTVVWELHQIVLRDSKGNQHTYRAGRDFEEMLFRVEGRDGIDCTPPRLLGVKFERAC